MLFPPVLWEATKNNNSCAQLQVSQSDRQIDGQTDRQRVSQSVSQGNFAFLRNPSCKHVMQQPSEILFGDVCLSIGVRVSSNCSVNQHRSGLPASPVTC